MIPASFIQDLKFRNNIEDVISSYVTLNRSGANLKGLCPFHSERTPSFTVYSGPDGHFHCYGCGAGGDVISFVMRAENVDYRAALDILAKRAGVELPEDDFTERGGVSRTKVLEMNLEAAKFFRQMLFSDAGAPGRAYFAKRQLSGATIKHFGLGYAPDTFDSLRNHLKSLGYTEDEMIEADLCARSKKNEKVVYDKFRNKVMFPIIDVSGNVIAFGGRVLDNSKPKYINTADTPAFKKSKTLFALNYAKNYSKDCLILCEGYMDVISLHAAGFQNAVACLGTAIGAEHARLMKRYTNKVIISTDSDEAGQMAVERALKVLAEVDIEARVLMIPGEKDPDEYIKANGADAFGKLIEASKPKIEYKIGKTTAKYDIGDPEGKIRAVRELCYAIADIYSRVERDIFIDNVAKSLDLKPDSVRSEVDSIIRKRQYAKKKDEHSEIIRETTGMGNTADPDYARSPAAAKAERTVIGMMLLHPEYIPSAKEKYGITADDFLSSLTKRLYEKLCTVGENFDFGMLSEDFTPDEVSEAEMMLSDRRRSVSDNGEAVFKEAVAKLKTVSDDRRFREENKGDIAALLEKRRKNINK